MGLLQSKIECPERKSIIYSEDAKRNSNVNIEKFKRRFKDVKYLSGPLSFAFFPLVAGKAVYLFGDAHESGNGCKIREDTGDVVKQPQIPFSLRLKKYTEQDIKGNVLEIPFVDGSDRKSKGDVRRKIEMASKVGIKRIADFLDETFKDEEDNEMKDFYFEIAYNWKKAFKDYDTIKRGRGTFLLNREIKQKQWDQYTDSAILSVQKKFEGCFSIVKTTKCNKRYPFTRFHYADIRHPGGDPKKLFGVSTPTDFFTFIRYLIQTLKDEEGFLSILEKRGIDIENLQSDIFLRFITQRDFINNMLENYFNPEIKNFQDFFPEDVLSRLFEWIEIGDEVGFAPYEFLNPYFRLKIIASVRKNPLYQKIINFLINKTKISIASYFKEISKDSRPDPLKTIYNVYAPLILFTMDVYTLSRILKPSLVDSQEVFVYAGAVHAENYADFFIYLAQDEDPEIKNNSVRKFYFNRVNFNNKCIEIGKLQKNYF